MEHPSMRRLVLVEAVGMDSTGSIMVNNISIVISGQIMIVAMNSVTTVMDTVVDTVVAVAMVAGVTRVVVAAMVVAAMKPAKSAARRVTLPSTVGKGSKRAIKVLTDLLMLPMDPVVALVLVLMG
jgi:hypothetical protein